jgi:hypothetical protein
LRLRRDGHTRPPARRWGAGLNTRAPDGFFSRVRTHVLAPPLVISPHFQRRIGVGGLELRGAQRSRARGGRGRERTSVLDARSFAPTPRPRALRPMDRYGLPGRLRPVRWSPELPRDSRGVGCGVASKLASSTVATSCHAVVPRAPLG